MLVTLHHSDFNQQIKKLFLENKLKHYSIDYETNNLLAWYEDVEYEVYNFTRVCRLDNRYVSYDIYIGPTEILLEFKN